MPWAKNSDITATSSGSSRMPWKSRGSSPGRASASSGTKRVHSVWPRCIGPAPWRGSPKSDVALPTSRQRSVAVTPRWLLRVRPTWARGWKLTRLKASRLRTSQRTTSAIWGRLSWVTVRVMAARSGRPVRRRASRIIAANSSRSGISSSSDFGAL